MGRSGGRQWCEECAAVVKLMRDLSGVAFEDRRPDGGRPASLDDLHHRHAEYGREACETVAAHRADLWLAARGAEDADMETYYRPSTLFRPSHFGEYLALARRAAPRPCAAHGSTRCDWCCREHGRIGCSECKQKS